ncbi:PAS domain S-box protein [Roseimaritima ulvae]|uniref:Putative diguanylate cyclase n=1 Tax=Roseimaritima ulvae TaxID=980254 RepID=A0A5B9R267_9BACT|nr:PAS domain S-box protein [Roseimaritima ulvae]QEG40443.1 putative diguanylate cyclase [Roseimaritima ulvae]
MRLDDIELWKLALERSEEPAAFVDARDYFQYCNRAWCQMLGYAESELLRTKWQDITASTDVGGDQREAALVSSGEKQEYYLEKHYIRKDHQTIHIGLYVHRHPPIGKHIGYVVFAKLLDGSREYQELKEQFDRMQLAVTELRRRLEQSDQLAVTAREGVATAKRNAKLIEQIIGRGEVQVGDRTTISGNSHSRIQNNNAKVLIAIAIVLGLAVIALGAFALGGGFSASSGDQQVEIQGDR